MAGDVLPRVALGDRAAVERCVARYGGLVWSLARRHSPDLGSAEDAAQEIFIDLWQSADRFDRARSSEVAFVAMIARRRLVDRHRKSARVPPTLPLDGGRTAGANGIVDQLEIQDELRLAREGITALREQERAVLELVFDAGLTAVEIANQLSLPVGTVKTLARRGMHRLRELLGHRPPYMTSEKVES